MKTKILNLKTISLVLMMMLINLGFSQQNNFIGQSTKTPEFDLPKSGPLLFDQISNPGNAWMVSQHFSTLANNTNTCAVADDFDVPQGETWDVHSIGILGSYWQGASGGGDTVNVYIMSDNNGVPGDTVQGYFAHTDLLVVEESMGDYISTYFEIYLPSLLTLTEGTYWVSVQLYSDFNATGQWGWLEHNVESAIYGAEWHWINPKDGFGLGAIEWTPANLLVGPWVQWEVSFAIYGAPLSYDLAAISITSPEDFYYGPPTQEQEVKVIIKNEGSTPQTGFDLTYSLGGTEVTENIGSVLLDFNESIEYTFTQTIDLSMPGSYDLSVSVDATGDENPDNDELYMEITVFDPTVYLMPSLEVSYDSTCSGTFTDAAGLEGNMTNEDDWGVYTIYPATPGAKIRLEFMQFDIAWGEFWIYDGINTNATELGFWEDDNSPGTVTASYGNTSGALTIQYEAQGWTPFEAPGWAANIICHMPVEDDFEVMKIELSHPTIFENDYVTAYAHIKNNGTTAITKDVTFSANGFDFATVTSELVQQSDTVIVEAIWNPTVAGNYEVTATIPDDMGGSNDNSASMMQHVYPFDHFYEGFESPLFPPDGWSQTGTAWTHHTYSPALGNGHAYLWAEYGLFDTLITPKLHIEQGDILSFYAYSSAWWPGELNLCWIDSETGDATLIQPINLPYITYQVFQVDVSSAAGDNYLAFVGKYNPLGGQGEVKIDEVEGIGIERFYFADDLKAYILEGDITPEENISTTLEIEVKNIGSEVQSGSEYSVKLMQQSGLGVIELMSYAGQDINPKQVLTFTLDYTFLNAGLYNCYVEVDFVDDMDMSNNISSPLTLYVQQEGTEQVYIGVNNDYNSNWWHPIDISSTGLYSQTVFLADEVGEANTITGIMYFYKLVENYPKYDNPITIWMSETEETNMDGPLEAANNYDLVFEGTFDAYPGYHGVYIPLDFVYSYQGGNLLVTTYKDYDDGNYADFYVGTSHVADTMVRYYNGYANNYPIDPYVQSTLDSVWQTHKTEYGNVKLFKFNLEGQYCTPVVLNGTSVGDYIDGVTFGDIENLGTGGPGGPAYNNYTSFSANVERGRTYEMTIQAETSGSNGSIAAWIDFNGNGELDDEGERVLHISSDESSQEMTVLVTIPEDAAIGFTLLRVRNNADPDLFASCQAVDYGETEDYGINIIETIQVYNPVPEFTAILLEEGNVEMNWMVPENNGKAYVEGFEMSTWPPQGGWEVKQSTSLTDPLTDPSGETWNQYNDDMMYVYNGAFSALCPESALDFNWLITPEVQLYGNDMLNFMLNYSSDASGYSKFYVLIEADDEWNIVLEYTDEITIYNNFDEQVSVSLEEFAGKVVRLAFVSENNNAYPIAIDDAILKGAEPTGKGVSGIEGYEIYKNGNLFADINDPSVVEFTDVLSVTENYIYCIFVKYDDGEKSEELCDNAFYLNPLTPPLNVNASADYNDVSVIWTAPDGGMTRFTDDFEDYSVGQQVACQNPDEWTTWTLSPCSSSDPYVSSEMPYSGDNSVVIEYEADLLYLTDELLTEGKYSYNFRMYIPEGYNGYFNVLQDHDLTIGALWGLQVFFDLNGIGTVDGGGYGAATFTYDYNEWMHMDIVVDLDTDWAEFIIDGEVIHEWQWSTGIGGGSGWLTLEGGDFYAWNSNNTCKYFIDDFQLIQLYEPTNMLDYNVYRDGAFLGTTTATEYNDTEVIPGYHNYCVSAVYNEGESEQVCDWVTLISAPENFAVEVQNENDVLCSWDEVIGTGFLGYHVYRDDEMVSGLINDVAWTDENVEGGTHIYYVTSVFEGAESLPSNIETVIILITPQNLFAEPLAEDIVLSWDPVGIVVEGNMVELYQHDETPANGLYQWFNIGYGVIFDISAYPGASVEMVDFHHSSYGITGTWSYMFHIVDWTTYTEIGTAGPFQTTGDDIWEVEIPMGSVATTTTQIGVFLEPMSNDPQDAYPILSIDASLEGSSYEASIFDYTQNNPAPGDFLLDLWIWAPISEKVVQAEKIKLNNTNAIGRSPFVPVNGDIIVDQKVKGGKALTGYNVYYAYDPDPFTQITNVTDTTYAHYGMATVPGLHKYYVTAQYEEGESDASNEVSVLISSVDVAVEDGVYIFPNPFSEVVYVNTDEDIISVSVVNSKGQVVFEEQKINSNQYQIDLKNNQSGIYHVRIETENGWTNRKMIKK